MPRLLSLLFFVLYATACIHSQGILKKVTDLMEFNLGSPPVDSIGFQAKIVMAPIAYYEPNTSFGFGFGANLLFKPRGAGPETRTSNLPVGISYTLNNQVFFSSGYTVFFPEEQWLLRGNLDYSNFPQSYYGVGNTTTEDSRREITYQQFLVEPLLLRQVKPSLFVGGGFRYNVFYTTELEEDFGDQMAGMSLQEELGSKSVGLEFAASYDNRDNVINAGSGSLIEFTQGFYDEILGGTNAFQLSKLDLRRYSSWGKKGIFALNLYARYSWKDTPPQELSTLGGPTLLRGFQEGRFRDRLALFTQGEYRWQAWKNIGFVFYGGAGQVATEVNRLDFSGLYYSVGTGLRVAIIPSENVNLRLDYALGFGPVKDAGFYLGIGEAF